MSSVAEVRSAADFLTGDQCRKLQIIRSIKQELAGIRFAPIDCTQVKFEPLSATLWYLSGYLGLAADAAQKADPDIAQQLRSLKSTIARFRVILLRPQPQIPMKLTEFQQAFFDNLHHTIEAIQTQDTSESLRPQDLPPALHDRFIGVTGKFLLQLYPRKDLWQPSESPMECRY